MASLAAPGALAAAALMLSALAAPRSSPAQARPTLEYEGAIATGLALRRLGSTARVLHIGAHPDDENTALLTSLALGRGADVAYLSITRGEGGQNSLGPELGTALGVIRTEELLAARRIDGAGQLFTRAVDFGFSKNAEETFTHWPRDSVLGDVVEVIRRYRPDVVVSVWSGTRRDGHGHHEASGILAREAVLAAGDPERFPAQIAAGLRPHDVAAYYWSARYGADGPDVELNTGELDPLLGRSYHQIAMASRSRHRSQDMGVPQAPGPRRTQFDRIDPANPPEVAPGPGPGPGRQLEGGPERGGSLLAGLDTLLSQRAVAAGFARAAERLRTYEAEIEAARAEFDPFAAWGVVSRLLRAGDVLEAALEAAGPAAAELRFHLEAEADDLRDATIAASSLRLDAVSDDEKIIPGQEFELELSAWNGGLAALSVRMEPALPADWTATPIEPAGEPDAIVVPPGERAVTRWSVTVPGNAALTTPYFLDIHGSAGDTSTRAAIYPWPDDPDVRGLPFAPAPVRGRFDVDLSTADGTHRLHAEREASWIGLDAREGEFRRPVRVVPRVTVRLTPELLVVPIEGLRASDARRLPVGVTVRNEAPDSTSGTVHVAAQEGWSVEPAVIEVTLAPEGGERTIRFDVAPPDDLAAGQHRVGALFEMPIPGCGGETPCAAPPRWFTLGYELIDYPHVDPHHLYRDAVSRIRALDVRVADVRVGYVAGVPDGVPEALDQLGVTWEPLGEAALADGDLSRFDVIVTGTRAYEVRPDLVARNDRLLDWARAGGTLIVQYNKYPALEGSFAPWPVTIDRPHGRVTDENAPVTVLEPDHPIFNTPNRIGPDAWDGWVQERGLYFWETWEGPLRPLLAMSDPGEAPLEGSLLVAPLGEGTYVYSALALFRQLPEGAPGAWRLLANLVSLGAEGGR